MPSVTYQPTHWDHLLAAIRLDQLARVTGRGAAAFLVVYAVGVFAVVRVEDGATDLALVPAGAAALLFVGLLALAYLLRPGSSRAASSGSSATCVTPTRSRGPRRATRLGGRPPPPIYPGTTTCAGARTGA